MSWQAALSLVNLTLVGALAALGAWPSVVFLGVMGWFCAFCWCMVIHKANIR